MHEAFVAYVTEWMGLDVDSVGIDRIHDVLRRECRRLGLTGEEYIRRLPNEHALQVQLYDAMVIPETWFMRGREALDWLCGFVNEKKGKAGKHQPLRILSIPCSTGEEPYSILMMLEMSGVELEEVEITAVDISVAALRKAEEGIYHSYSFRGLDTKTRSRYFLPVEDGESLAPHIRQRVEFRCGNMAAKDFLFDEAPYDIIFCRNLLIYFTDECRLTAMENIKRLLKVNGVVFAGHSEAAYFAYNGFCAIKHPRVFAFRASSQTLSGNTVCGSIEAGKSLRSRGRMRKSAARKRVIGLRGKGDQPLFPFVANAEKEALPDPPRLSLSLIKKQADAGDVTVALEQCEEYLKHNPLDADALCLAALLYEAKGDRQRAEDYFRKTLYIEPCHEEGIVHYGLLLRDTDRGEQADILARRCRRDR